MKIALFYYVVVKDNAIGRVDRLILENLCDRYSFTVFATRFDNPRPDKISWIRTPALLRPAPLAILSFKIAAAAIFFWHRVVKGLRFDIVQSSDGVFGRINLADAHFCNRYYLTRLFSRNDLKTLRGISVSIARVFSSALEAGIYRRVPVVVVPSQGLRRELAEMYRVDPGKVAVIPLPRDATIQAPSNCEKADSRHELGIGDTEIVLTFAALGDFERKGLGPLIDALADPRLKAVRLLVAGGNERSLRPYIARAKSQQVLARVTFCGTHPTIRRFLWAADAFVLPSRYEVFPTVAIQAASSALPLITTHLNGVEEYATDGVTGFTIRDCSAGAIADAIAGSLLLSAEERRLMGYRARDAVQGFGVDRFIESWDRVYSGFGAEGEMSQ